MIVCAHITLPNFSLPEEEKKELLLVIEKKGIVNVAGKKQKTQGNQKLR